MAKLYTNSGYLVNYSSWGYHSVPASSLSVPVWGGGSSTYYSKEESVRILLNRIFKILLFILLPYMILIGFYHQQIISLVYERGAFTDKSTSMTALAFLGYSFAVLGYACQEIFNRVYYALRKFKIPMYVSVFCISLKLVLDLLLYRTAGIVGISLSTAVCLLTFAVIMGIFCTKR